jgi:DNA polymerase I-like protein with 3'-5' exonuclease and polymerase domains
MVSNEDKDIHASTASILFEVDTKAVTEGQRSLAQTINLSTIYGSTSSPFIKGVD